MSRIGTSAAAIIVLALNACHDSTAPVPGDSYIRVANATIGTLGFSIDGRAVEWGLSMNGLSNPFAVAAGTHRIRLGETLGSPATEITVETTRDAGFTVVAYPSASAGVTAPATTVLVDTGIVPIGKSRLRVANLAGNAGALEIWRSQPGSSSGSRITTPIPIGMASSYLESDPGVWEVWTTAVGSEAKTASSGPIEIPDPGRRTVLLLDSPAGPRFVVVAD
jgi:hypothetical protein